MGNEAISVGLGITGWVIIVLYLAAVVALGSFFARGQKEVSDYFLAGRSMGWLAVAISIVATDLSALSYIGCPSWIYREDIRYAVGLVFGPVLWAAGAFIFLSLFYKLKLYTAYEFLGRRSISDIGGCAPLAQATSPLPQNNGSITTDDSRILFS